MFVMLLQHKTVTLGQLKKIPAILAGKVELEVILSQNGRNFFSVNLSAFI
jgi:hypothetical protein